MSDNISLTPSASIVSEPIVTSTASPIITSTAAPLITSTAAPIDNAVIMFASTTTSANIPSPTTSTQPIKLNLLGTLEYFLLFLPFILLFILIITVAVDVSYKVKKITAVLTVLTFLFATLFIGIKNIPKYNKYKKNPNYKISGSQNPETLTIVYAIFTFISIPISLRLTL
jgi:hypothetical protein